MDVTKFIENNDVYGTDWSINWPNSEGYWWLYRQHEHKNPFTLLICFINSKGKFCISGPERFCRSQQEDDWRFSKAIMPNPPEYRPEDVLNNVHQKMQKIKT
jgi:hypothetical protein